MRRVIVTIPDELEAELDEYLRQEDPAATIDGFVEDAVRQRLARQTHLAGREYRPASRPFRITPLEEKDDLGEPDVSINHDRYLAEG